MTLGTHRLRVLRHARFRRFLLGQTTSLLGSGMNTIATTFAVLRLPGGGVDAVGGVMAARILAVLVVLLLGGVFTDRWGARTVMLAADALRFGSQAALALLLLTGGARVWEVVVLAVLLGMGEGGFMPGLSALVPGLVPPEELASANALLGMARPVTSILGPGLAGLLVAAFDPGTVVALDAVSYGMSVVALAGLPVTRVPGSGRGVLSELGRGWREFTSRTWLWVTTLHIGLFNFFLWAPFLVLGPSIAEQRLGGARAWGLVLASEGIGAILGGLLLLGRNPRRGLTWSVAASVGWAAPVAALAMRLPLACVAVAAFVAGIGAAVCTTLAATVIQRDVPAEVRGRIGAFDSLGAFALGPLGLALAGPVSGVVGAERLLAFGVLWQVTAVGAVLAVPSVHRHEATPLEDKRVAVH
ncbi:putative MFS family arabinose efflux permease [Streptomyces sp. BK022]|uniref:MFS transporter n=1 Tax=Streptomyces sp. BK022 TaxID=2512123 RepID=UPI0010294A21|nr:MFS transporter [Streptomyces sp. BK022]RZU45599.1 putative MFS family arabinose efflux permease [Streptomyces sp. BK022]